MAVMKLPEPQTEGRGAFDEASTKVAWVSGDGDGAKVATETVADDTELLLLCFGGILRVAVRVHGEPT